MNIEQDKLLHFSFCFIMLIGLAIFFSLKISIISTIIIGFLKEIWDEFYGSGFSWGDIVADLVGILTGTLVFLLK